TSGDDRLRDLADHVRWLRPPLHGNRAAAARAPAELPRRAQERSARARDLRPDLPSRVDVPEPGVRQARALRSPGPARPPRCSPARPFLGSRLTIWDRLFGSYVDPE